jgi:beta-N-acetylglucosaminidase
MQMEQGLQLGQLNDQIIKAQEVTTYIVSNCHQQKMDSKTHNGMQYIDIDKIHTISIDKITTLYKSKTSS